MIRLLEPGSLRSVPYYVIPRLRKGGYHTFQALAKASVNDIARYSKISKKIAEQIHRQCREVNALDHTLKNSIDTSWISIVELIDGNHVENSEAVKNYLVNV